ncbi:hypothetical protein EVAR_88514_1 [Eumeta japonica]|uniref:Uncharacterized protein n=1 Tax=Eumeta variegata TaxID=151549 RepID=A0A4C1XUZ7_EUMVA|nr:hypothetical protein EVAR_88514_1 [Eumeta japonica]
MSCHASACVGCVRLSRTKKSPKQHVDWQLSVAPIYWGFEDFTYRCRSAWDGRVRARYCPTDATRWSSRHRKSCGDQLGLNPLAG